MHYLLTPLDMHYDRGFGAVANSFMEAADDLREAAGKGATFLNRHLPISFLYRHAIELFLKSGIVILHKKLRLPYGPDGSSEEPHVLLGEKWRPMHTVHDTAPLYTYLKALFSEHRETLAGLSDVSWEFPPEADTWMEEISRTDSSSTFFRYPVTKHAPQDHLKSTSKERHYLDIMARMGPGQPAQKAFFVLNEKDEVVQAFHQDDAHASATMETLHQAADMLYGCHAAMRGTLTGGW